MNGLYCIYPSGEGNFNKLVDYDLEQEHALAKCANMNAVFYNRFIPNKNTLHENGDKK